MCKGHGETVETLQILHAGCQVDESCCPPWERQVVLVTEDSEAGLIWRRGESRVDMKLGKWTVAQAFSWCTVMAVSRGSQEKG